MFGASRRSTAFSESLELVANHLPGVRDGQEEAIHQARVEIRRAREMLALAALHSDDDDTLRGVDRTLKKAGRALGRARDADVLCRRLEEIQARLRPAAELTALLLSRVNESRDRARRKSIKTLEKLDFENEVARVIANRAHGVELGTARDLRRSLPNHLADRAFDLKNAIERAGGIRFPGRLHAMRIALKHLRYAIELADAVSLRRPARARRLLKRTQAALGAIHDWDILDGQIRDATLDRPSFADEAEMLRQYVHAERARHHAEYLQCRPALLALCETLAPSRAWRIDPRAVAAAAVAVPSVALMLRRRTVRAA
jgi:CHAD domain-containing protein